MDSHAGLVVGYDGSPEADLALNWAVEECQRTGDKLALVQSAELEGVPHMGPAGWMTEQWEQAENEPAVARAIETLGEDHTHVVRGIGSAAAHLVDASETARLVVIGTRGHGAAVSVLVGSTAHAVIAHARCPVVVVRAPKGATSAPLPGPERPVVVGVDDLTVSAAAVDVAAQLASEAGAPLHITRAVDLPTPAMPFAIPALDASYEEAARTFAAEVVADAAARVSASHPDLKVTTDTPEGAPKTALTHDSAAAGLIVVGSRGRGGFAGLMLGSVGHTVIQNAECPVVVVPQKYEP